MDNVEELLNGHNDGMLMPQCLHASHKVQMEVQQWLQHHRRQDALDQGWLQANQVVHAVQIQLKMTIKIFRDFLQIKTIFRIFST